MLHDDTSLCPTLFVVLVLRLGLLHRLRLRVDYFQGVMACRIYELVLDPVVSVFDRSRKEECE